MTVWKKFEEQRAVIQAAIESPADDVAVSSSSSVDQEDVEEKDDNRLGGDDVGVDDVNDPLPFIGPPFVDEPLDDEDICEHFFTVNFRFCFVLSHNNEIQNSKSS